MLTTNIKVKSIWDEFFAKLTNRQAKEIANAKFSTRNIRPNRKK